MKKKTYKYEGGGDLAMATPMIGSALNMVLPGLGSAVTPILGQIAQSKHQSKILNDHYNSISQSTNPYGNYAMGGELTGDAMAPVYDGNSHSNGGIQVNPDGTPSPNAVAEVEDGEVKARLKDKTIIFSSKLKI